jgi:hypothetical protein
MTTTTPPVITPVPIDSFPGTGYPLTNITPFTYRDGWTFLEKQEALMTWIWQSLIPWLQTTTGGLDDSWVADVAALTTSVNNALSAQATTVNAALTTQDNNNNASIAALTTLVNNAVQTVITNSLTANDSVVQQLVNNVASLTRVALNALYQPVGSVSDTAVASLVNTAATATQVALDARYFRASGSSLGVAAGGTGRTTDTPYSLLAGGTTATGAHQDVATGTAGQVLQSGGPAALPSFATLVDDTAARMSTVYSSSKVAALVAGLQLYGTYANRPAANTVPDNTTYAASDIPEMYQTSQGVWHNVGAGGNELGYAEVIPLFQTSSLTPVDVTGFTTTFIVGERPILIRVSARLASATLGNVAILAVMLDGAVRARIEIPSGAVASTWQTGAVAVRISGLVPGSTHIAKCGLYMLSAGSGAIALTAGDSTDPNNIQVVTV